MHLQGNFENNIAEAFNLINTGKKVSLKIFQTRI